MFSCNECGVEFTTKTNMYRHMRNICKKKITENNICVKCSELEKVNVKLLSENEYLKKTIEDMLPFKTNYMIMTQKSFETNNKMMELTNETTNKVIEFSSESSKLQAETSLKSLSTIKYISKHLTLAPPLKYEKQEIAGLLEYSSSKKYKPVDYVIYNYTLKKLPEWVGNIIIKVYKKENPFDQNIWVTDNSRFSYVIFDVIEDASGKKSEWITDKSGTKITERIIAPTLELLQEMLELYLEETRDIHLKYDDMEMEEISRHSNNKQKAFDIVKEIKDEFLHKDVLKFITPFFSTDPVKLEDAITKTLNDKDEPKKEEKVEEKEPIKVSKNVAKKETKKVVKTVIIDETENDHESDINSSSESSTYDNDRLEAENKHILEMYEQYKHLYPEGVTPILKTKTDIKKDKPKRKHKC